MQAFSGPTEAELGSSPPEVALREFLRKGELSWVQTRYWRLLAEDERYAEFVHGRLSASLEWLLFEQVDGKWKWVSYSSNCAPTSVVRRGTVVTWSLARKQPPLRRGTRRLWIDLGPGECAGGLKQNPRAHFAFRSLDRKLLLTAWLEPVPPGGYTCVGTIEPSRKVKLPSRLGGRKLYDGATYPPRLAAATRSPH